MKQYIDKKLLVPPLGEDGERDVEKIGEDGKSYGGPEWRKRMKEKLAKGLQIDTTRTNTKRPAVPTVPVRTAGRVCLYRSGLYRFKSPYKRQGKQKISATLGRK